MPSSGSVISKLRVMGSPTDTVCSWHCSTTRGTPRTCSAAGFSGAGEDAAGFVPRPSSFLAGAAAVFPMFFLATRRNAGVLVTLPAKFVTTQRKEAPPSLSPASISYEEFTAPGMSCPSLFH